MHSNKEVRRRSQRHTQYAALCYRLRKTSDGAKTCEVLLITSRATGRWVPPKGWPIKGCSPSKTAATEAFEEAGVLGKVSKSALGRYKYLSDPERNSRSAGEAYIFPLAVEKMAKKYKEKGQRRLKWVSPKKAALMVHEPKLRKILRNFDPNAVDTPKDGHSEAA